MNTELHLSVYTHYPNIPKLTKDDNSQYDYITLLFEISFLNSNGKMPKKIFENNFIFTNSLFVDYYVEDKNNKHLSLNFDIMESNEDGVTFECYNETKGYSEKAYKPRTTKKARAEKGYDVDCKKIYTIKPSNQYGNIAEALTDFYDKQIEKQYLSIEQFLIENNIVYNKEEFQKFLLSALNVAKESITKEYIESFGDNFLKDKVSEVDTLLSAQNLEKELPINSSPSKKIKI